MNIEVTSNEQDGAHAADSAPDAADDDELSKMPVFPWFGIDIGGTLVKLVYFEPLDLSKDEEQKEGDILRTIRHYLVGNTAYGETGFRDVHMELNAIKIGERRGNLHFIRFPTSQMELFVELCVTRKLHMLTFKVFATGGGAYKFESMVRERLNIGWHKCDELEMLIQGIEFLNENNAGRECYYFEIESKSSSNNQPSNTEQHATNSNNNDLNETMSTHSTSSSSSSNGSSSDDDFNISLSDSTFRKTSYNFANSYPYIVVNIGSGVSILLVKGERKYKRISGTSIGGGTFLGLCCLLTSCSTYEEAIDLATRGNSNKVDKLVKDIYGGDYSRFGLPGNIVASSFGHMNVAEKRDEATREDLARATLQTVLNNIGLIARDCATNYNCERVLFVGSFLRLNDLSMQLLAYATDYWSKGRIKALFLEHEGYFGAVGCLKNFIQN